ncbi:MAG: antibiotic biosynthesis monooxygenase [Desulfobacterales bacterium]|jgi:heme-degrading monooxygenase HmoA
MLAKIFIKRQFITAKTREVIALLTKLRSAAMRQPGYISGETLTNYANQQHLCVIATWQSMEEWLQWKENPERKKLEAMLEIFQSGPTAYEEYFLGTPFQKTK